MGLTETHAPAPAGPERSTSTSKVKERDVMKRNRLVVGMIAVVLLLCWGGASFAAAPITATAKITKVEDKWITFQTESGETVKSKLSSKRTKVMQGSDEIAGEDLEVGDKIKITYVKDGEKNEPSVIEYLGSD
jgi:hypothetical protein